jgi:hypothetical protein
MLLPFGSMAIAGGRQAAIRVRVPSPALTVFGRFRMNDWLCAWSTAHAGSSPASGSRAFEYNSTYQIRRGQAYARRFFME